MSWITTNAAATALMVLAGCATPDTESANKTPSFGASPSADAIQLRKQSIAALLYDSTVYGYFPGSEEKSLNTTIPMAMPKPLATLNGVI
jgi:hypothetical protein